jgi:hypothetical protein
MGKSTGPIWCPSVHYRCGGDVTRLAAGDLECARARCESCLKEGPIRPVLDANGETIIEAAEESEEIEIDGEVLEGWADFGRLFVIFADEPRRPPAGL